MDIRKSEGRAMAGTGAVVMRGKVLTKRVLIVSLFWEPRRVLSKAQTHSTTLSHILQLQLHFVYFL